MLCVGRERNRNLAAKDEVDSMADARLLYPDHH